MYVYFLRIFFRFNGKIRYYTKITLPTDINLTSIASRMSNGFYNKLQIKKLLYNII